MKIASIQLKALTEIDFAHINKLKHTEFDLKLKADTVIVCSLTTNKMYIIPVSATSCIEML